MLTSRRPCPGRAPPPPPTYRRRSPRSRRSSEDEPRGRTGLLVALGLLQVIPSSPAARPACPQPDRSPPQAGGHTGCRGARPEPGARPDRRRRTRGRHHRPPNSDKVAAGKVIHVGPRGRRTSTPDSPGGPGLAAGPGAGGDAVGGRSRQGRRAAPARGSPYRFRSRSGDSTGQPTRCSGPDPGANPRSTRQRGLVYCSRRSRGGARRPGACSRAGPGTRSRAAGFPAQVLPDNSSTGPEEARSPTRAPGRQHPPRGR